MQADSTQAAACRPIKRAAGRVLVIEDEAVVAWELVQRLHDWGFEVCGVASRLADALVKADKYRPHVALVDVQLQGGDDGVAAAKMMRDSYGVAVVFVTGMDDAATRKRMFSVRPVACVAKPYNLSELRAAIERAVSERRG